MHLIILILRKFLAKVLDIPANKYHPLVWISGKPKIGSHVYIGGFTEINAKGSILEIGDNCDIASFVVINCSDSSRKTIGLSGAVERKPITIEHNVFIGTQATILGGVFIGHHSVVSAGSILKNVTILPYSLVIGGQIKARYYTSEIKLSKTIN